jgi:hypothetical protein
MKLFSFALLLLAITRAETAFAIQVQTTIGTVATVSARGADGLDWMWIASIGTREILAKGYDLSKVVSVEQGWLAPPYEYPCVMILFSREPNIKCPEMGPDIVKGAVACFKTPEAKQVFNVGGFETVCPPL